MNKEDREMLLIKYKILVRSFSKILLIKNLNNRDLVYYSNRVESLKRDILRLKGML